MSEDRAPCYVECTVCGHSTTQRIDPDDSGSTIRFWCRGQCDRMTEHETGSVRFGSLGA